jgi:hypothetical protein
LDFCMPTLWWRRTFEIVLPVKQSLLPFRA